MAEENVKIKVIKDTSKKVQRKSKCVLCGESFEKEDLTLRSNKKYCKECLEIHNEQVKKNKSSWDLLFEYICEVYKIEKPTGMMFKQMKDYRSEDYSYTDIGMYYTLKYFYEVMEDNKVLEGSGLGIIPYFYEKAKKHYNKIFDLEDIVDNFENIEQVVKIKTKISNKEDDVISPLPLQMDWEETNEND